MSKDDFYSLAVTILLRQKLLDTPLFTSDWIDECEIENGKGSMPFDAFIDELYEELKGILS